MQPFIESFKQSFSALNARSLSLLEITEEELLFAKPRKLEHTFAMLSVGEYILRSAASVEQTFGGITTRLWDDPFEWTLPEKLSTTELIRDYLDEVEETTAKGFAFFASDDDLKRQMPAPVELKPILQILLETLARAEHYQGRAFAVFQMISDKKLPRL